MFITCHLCKTKIESLVLPEDNGILDLVQKLMLHASTMHVESIQTMQGDIARILDGVGFYLLMTGFADIDANQTKILDKLAEFEAKLLDLLDFEGIVREGETEVTLKKKIRVSENGNVIEVAPTVDSVFPPRVSKKL